MLAVFAVVVPIFALILAGWLARRTKVLGPNATGELNRFVVWLALPALLFDIVAKAKWSELWQPAFVFTFGLAGGVIFAATVIAGRVRRRPLPDAAVDGLNAAYPNTGFMGFPLALAVAGTAGLAPTMIASIMVVCVFFAATIVLIEIGLQTERNPGRLAAKVVVSLAKNPLIVSPILGGVVLASGYSLPEPVDAFLKLLSAAASPCALVALGLFLAEKRPGAQPDHRTIGALVALKLIAQPALTWLLAAHVFRLDARLTLMAVLLAALPTGTGPFMVAEFYGREAGVTSRTVLVSTILSLVTITLLLSSPLGK